MRRPVDQEQEREYQQRLTDRQNERLARLHEQMRQAEQERGRPWDVSLERRQRECDPAQNRITGPPGPPVESVLVPFQRFRHFRKPVFCGVSRVSEAAELVSGSSARKGVEVQVLSSALVIYGVSRYRGEPRFFWAHPTAKKRVY